MPDVSRLGRGELQGLDGRLGQQPPQPRVRVVLDEGLRVFDPNLEYNYAAAGGLSSMKVCASLIPT